MGWGERDEWGTGVLYGIGFVAISNMDVHNDMLVFVLADDFFYIFVCGTCTVYGIGFLAFSDIEGYIPCYVFLWANEHSIIVIGNELN